MLYFLLICLIIIYGFATAFMPEKKFKIRTVVLITLLCFPLGILIIATQIFK